MFSYVNPGITLDSVLSEITVFEIAAKYLGITELPICINNPCRKDENPSLGLYYSNKYDTISYKDFATGETGNIFGLLSKLWNCTFDEVLKKISEDNDFNSSLKVKHSRQRNSVRRKDTELSVRIRDWEQYDIDFWEKYGISIDWLKFGDVFPISYIILTRSNGSQEYIKAEKYAYVYVERKDGNITLKVYQPYSKKIKWLSKHDSSVIDLWTKLPKSGDKLIITSSRKDALCTWACTGIPCISMQGEGYWPKPQVIAQLKERFNHIFVLFDNDFNSEENHGHLFAKKLSSFFNLIMLELPSELKEKDQSDVVKHYGKQKLRDVVLSLINTALNNLNE